MTAPRSKIEMSLAERGRPAMWATEDEAAAFSGVSPSKFRLKIKAWEAKGFPKVNPENGKRPIPWILAFWGLPTNAQAVTAPTPVLTVVSEPVDEMTKENWRGTESIRRAS